MDATSHSGEENAAAAGISAASRCVDEDEVLLLAMNLRDIRPFNAHFSSCDRCAARLESARREVAEQRAFADDAQRLLLPRSRVVAPSPAEAAALDIPGYRIERETHRGGQGVVYAAVQDQTNRPVAVSSAATDWLSLPSRWKINKFFHKIGELPGPFSCMIRRLVLVQRIFPDRLSKQAVPKVPK